MNDRLSMLREMVRLHPADPFPQYGLAMELQKRGDVEAAKGCFAALVQHHPEYVAAYLMFGNLLRRCGEVDQAAATYRQGIEVASAIGDDHTRSELQAALGELS